MLCEKCGKNTANMYYKQIINGKTSEYRLCSECAGNLKEKGEINFNIPQLFPFNPIFKDDDFLPLSNFLAVPLDGLRKPNSEQAVKSCFLCGSRFDEIVKKGRVGCAECYKSFSGELERTLHSLHGQSAHRGRRARSLPQKEKADKNASDLKELLKKAVESENYEEAARLRDEIKSREKGDK